MLITDICQARTDCSRNFDHFSQNDRLFVWDQGCPTCWLDMFHRGSQYVKKQPAVYLQVFSEKLTMKSFNEEQNRKDEEGSAEENWVGSY